MTQETQRATALDSKPAEPLHTQFIPEIAAPQRFLKIQGAQLNPLAPKGSAFKSAREIRVVDTFEDFLRLENTWNYLFEKSLENRVYLTFDWIRCWWEAFGRDKKLFILTAGDNDDIALIAPLCITAGKFRGFKVRKLTSIANDISPSWDFVGDLSSGGHLAFLVEEIFSHKDLWDIVEFQKINKTSMTYNLLTNILKEKDYEITESIKSPCIEIEGAWDDFLSKRSTRFRKALRNKINRAEKSADIKIAKAEKKEDLKQALKDAFLISSRSWKETQKTSITSSVENETFYQKATEVMGDKERVAIWTLKKGDLAIAFEYHIKYKDIVYPIRADYDEAYKDLSPGSLLEYNILKNIFTEKSFKFYDSCGNTYQYLLNWSTRLNEYYNFYLFNRNTKSYLLYDLEFKIIPFLRKAGIRKYWKQNNKYAGRKN